MWVYLFNIYIVSRNRKYTYTDEESLFIKSNYPISGSKFILDNLDISSKSLDSFIYLNKLKINRFEIDINLNDKYLCYMLGLMWADGDVSESTRSRVSLKLVEDDIKSISNYLYKVCNWKYQLYISKNINFKNTIRLSYSDKKFKMFLEENDYCNKSKVSPCKIISLIPADNKKYFFRGVVDGDGCFFIKKYESNTSRMLFITSTYYQDWTYMINICNEIGCNFRIRRIINNKNKNYRSSTFQISSGHIIKFGNYIYSDFFGLGRKYNKFIEIRDSYKYSKCIKN